MLRAMRKTFIVCSASLLAACLGRQAPNSSAASAPGASRSSAALAPIHQVSEVPSSVVETASEPVPGFMRGINLGNALDAPSEGAWGVTLSPRHFAMAKAAGLDHVRLPVRFSAHAQSSAPFTIDEALFKRVDFALAQAKEQGLSIIIDLHHYEELMKKPDENAERLLGLWKQIAERYQGQPSSVAFELINEPCDDLKSDKLNPITQRTLALVRKTNPTRTVFVDSYFWADAAQLKNLELPEDPNLVPSFHNYQPVLFTHQGMDWMPPEFQTRGIVFPGPPAAPVTPVAAANGTWASGWLYSYNSAPIAQNSNGPSAVFDYFKLVEAYVKASKRRVYMGEFGVADNADPQSRQNWLHLIKTEAEKRHIGWALWDDGGRFHAMNVQDGTWVEPVRKGLFE